MTDHDRTAVAIVGMAGVFPGAPTIERFWENVRDGVDAIGEVPAARWDPVFFDPDAPAADRFYCRRGGFVDDVARFDPVAFGIMPVAVESAEPDQLLALAAADAALADAGDPHEHVRPEKVGVVLGRGGYMNDGVARLDQRVRTAQQLVEALRALVPGIGEEDLARVKAEFQDRLGPERPEGSIGLVPNLAASRIANRLDLRGPAYTIDAACASSLIAVDDAVGQLATGRCDLMLAGGVHHCHDLTLWSVFTQLGALSPSQRIRPFSKAADGILVGEGTGVFVLKRLADAERDGDRIYAVVRGTGVASDGRDASLMSPRPDGQVLAVQQAWARSGLDPAGVGLIEAHGTATPVGDATELETLRRVFGEAQSGRPPAGLGSVKSMIGHAMPAAGAAGLAKAALAIFHGTLPPTLHADEPNPAIDATRFRLVQQAEPWEGDALRRAGVNAFGFGGINAHVVVEEHPSNRGAPAGAPVTAGSGRGAGATPTQAPEAAEPVLLLAGADAAELLARLDALGDGALDPPALAHAPVGGPARLGIVAPTAKKLTLARKVLERGTPFRGRNDVWFAPEGLCATGGRVAWLFPGVEPVFEPRVEDVAARFGLSYTPPDPTLSPLVAQSHGIVDVGRLLADVLGRIGARADVVAGHSLGEWTGQIVSGMVPDDYVEDFLGSLRPESIEVSDVVFVALGCGADAATELIDGIPDAHVSHDNCPHQSVVCAHGDAIPVVMDRARARRVLAQELPFRSGFHSPLFAPFVPGLAAQFDELPLFAPSVPMWSATTCGPYPGGHDEIEALALRHLLEPVRFRELTLALHDDGVRVFLQIGTGSLVGFVEDTLRDRDHLAMSLNVARHSGLGQLRRVAAALWVEGAAVDVTAVDHPHHTAHGSASTRAVPLQLGSSLVRDLTPLALAPGAAARPDLPASDPLLAAFDAALDESVGAARAVLAAAGARDRRAPSRARVAPAGNGNGPPTPPPPPATPAVRETVHDLSVAAQPWWADHAFFEQPAGWPVEEDTFPLVPMTGIIEMLAAEAEALVPGTVAVAIEDVRAFRWVAVSPPTSITVRAVVDPDAPAAPGETVVRASIENHARATVRLAASFPAPPPPAARPITGDLHLPITVDRLYADRHLFHGPAYQGVLSFDEFGTDGVRGRLLTKPFPGSLLDNAGQLFGYWVACRVDRDRLVLPTSIHAIRFHGPHPPAGTEVDCTVNVTSIDEQTVRADLELTVDGAVWARVEGWEDRRFQSDDRLFAVLKQPQRLLLAEPQPGGWVLVREGWPDSASRDVVRRRFLGRDERDAYDTRTPNAQRQWLLGRIAAKDAVRQACWQAGVGPIFPVEVGIGNDPDGRPVVTGPHAGDLHVSIAHTTGIGVALAAAGQPVGIDVEKVEDRSDRFAALTLTDAEQRLFADTAAGSTDRELTRWWAAKEAAAKAAGTGLQGRPRDFEVTAVDGDRLRIGDLWIATTVLTHGSEEHVVAWTPTHP